MSSENFKKLEKSWNISHRIMLSLPRTAHRYLMEEVTKKEHIIKSLKKRFIVFLSKLKSSKKKVLGNVLKTIEQDCGSTTRKNIRNMILQEIRYDLKSAPYFKLSDVDTWRINPRNNRYHVWHFASGNFPQQTFARNLRLCQQ